MTATSDYLNQPVRSEAEARAAVKPKVRCLQGETFERMERRLFRKNREAFDLAISMARTALEDAGMGPESLKDFDGHIADHCGDYWNVDPRKEE
jgi:3-oxoacyl-[acyl-carrier-protein] synthase III